ncbi:unnamed protein product [Effrenium voratum]|nr:unnamed protein product [Effrenium voratum]
MVNGWDIGLPWVEPRPPSDDDAEYEEFLSPTRRQPANVFHQARQSPDERRKKRRGLNLVGAYNESKVCTDPNNCSDNNCADGCNNSNDSFSLGAKLHHLVHPNCGSSHGFTGADQNLNVLSTLLHLFTDVARSVTIFVVGLLIQVGVIKQPGQADAICALAVAALVVLGSFSLLWQVAAEVWKTTAQYKPLFGGIQLAEPEDLEAGLANLGLPASSSQQYL